MKQLNNSNLKNSMNDREPNAICILCDVRDRCDVCDAPDFDESDCGGCDFGFECKVRG